MARGDDTVTSASEPDRRSSGRAHDKWRRRTSARSETATHPTPLETGAEPREASDADVAPARTVTSRAGAREFVRENLRTLVALALVVVGVVFVILGWYGAANTNILTEQIPYLISGGLLGVALIIVAGLFASSASLERQNRELRRDLVRALGSAGKAGGRLELAASENPRDGKVFLVSGGRSYHFAGCPIVEGKESSTVTLEEAQGSGYETCKLCGPE